METSFAPAERTDRNVFNRQIENISTSPVMSKLLEASCGLLVVLNEERQIVGLNEAFLNSLGMKNLDRVLGLRLGETLECIHATERPHGCGTTPHCGSCGAAIATMSAIIDDVSSEQTCALTAEKDGKTVDLFLSVTARPFMVDGSRWILLFAQDITQQHSHASLEKIFYHDFNNILMVLTGCGDLLSMKQPDNALAGHDFCHELAFCVANGILGSVDANRGDLLLGWDTDQFPTNIYEATLAMYIILKGGGFTTGGLNFDAHIRRQSIDYVDLFYAHIGAMDTFARGLKSAARMIKDKVLENAINERYKGWTGELGSKIENRKVGFEELESYIFEHGEPELQSGRQELLENLLNDYI